MILAGSILRRDYAWGRRIIEKPSAFRKVRNEVSKQDLVVRLAGMIAPLGLGNSGTFGFKEREDVVHSTNGPWKACDNGINCLAPVHNVPLGEYDHSDMFLQSRHCEELWLPVLWGFIPWEYDRFLRLCSEAVALEEQKQYRALAIIEAELREQYWTWTVSPHETPMTFEEFVTNLASEILEYRLEELGPTNDMIKRKVVESVVSRSFRLIYRAVVDAIEETERQEPRCEIIAALHPIVACRRAVETLLLA
jgi:hypothetical protein